VQFAIIMNGKHGTTVSVKHLESHGSISAPIHNTGVATKTEKATIVGLAG